MKICFTLDDVLRAKTSQIGKIYKKYVKQDIDLESLDFSTNDYADIFNFDSDREYKDFLYNLYAYEIFAEASTTEKMVDKTFNLWHMGLSEIAEDNDTTIDVMISNPMEFNASIGYSYFFLSKIATRVRDIYFPTDSMTVWDKCDVLVTAEPRYLDAENKPEGKVVIKIKMPYNEKYTADYEYDKLSDFLNDNEIIKTLIDDTRRD